MLERLINHFQNSINLKNIRRNTRITKLKFMEYGMYIAQIVEHEIQINEAISLLFRICRTCTPSRWEEMPGNMSCNICISNMN